MLDLLARVAPQRTLSLHPEAMAALCAYDFPGNVRELRNLLERASLMCDHQQILVDHLHLQVLQVLQGGEPIEQTGGETQLDDAALLAALTRHRGSRRVLAQQLGLSERTLYRRLRALQNKLPS